MSEAAADAPADAGTYQDENAEMTMEDVLAASDEQLARKPVHRGMITTGEVIMLSQDGIIVDVGAKIEGLLPYNQLFEFETNAADAGKYFKPGDEIQVYVVRSDIPNNTIVLSKKRADQERAWNLLQEIHDKGKPVEVEIIEKVRGGLVANLGIRAFLPASQVDVRRVNDLSPFVGQRLKVKIIELNRRRNRVIISRRSILEEEIAEKKAETLTKLEPGLKLDGEVVEITDFGVFVNLGGIDGLVHRSELTHGRFSHPRDVVKVGEKVRVEVLDMDLERERINLSMKSLMSNPWDSVLGNYSIGQKIGGKVTNLTPFGAFVEIEPGLEGLIHVSEMSWTKRVRHPKEIVSEGEEVEAMILKIDTNQQRISLGLRQTQPDPWSSLPDRYPPGTEVTGPITGITDFGVFMEIEEGIEGLVHISELSHDHIENINDHFKRGDEVTAVILNIDPVEQRASLSRKRLLPYSAQDLESVGTGTPASRGVGGRRGRRSRRGSDIDYDYSYAATDSNTKATTKLGDVYADLFAQFGLTETKGEEEGEGETEAVEAQGAAGEQPVEAEAQAEPVEAPADQAEAPADEPAADAAKATESELEAPAEAEVTAAKPQAAEAEAPAATEEDAKAAATKRADEGETENAIDAAEAAAMLTAAFREGRRPKQAEAEAEGEAQAADSADDDAEDDADDDDDDDDVNDDVEMDETETSRA
ncbi:MAG TPA: 30S ribosomal protein S1 [Trueperaceae bacterium]|nr:30S ribosomal protein S1 [Trueperaceae bacterium]